MLLSMMGRALSATQRCAKPWVYLAQGMGGIKQSSVTRVQEVLNCVYTRQKVLLRGKAYFCPNQAKCSTTSLEWAPMGLAKSSLKLDICSNANFAASSKGKELDLSVGVIKSRAVFERVCVWGGGIMNVQEASFTPGGALKAGCSPVLHTIQQMNVTGHYSLDSCIHSTTLVGGRREKASWWQT